MTSANKQKVYEIIIQKIQTEITAGILKAGEKLPPERELAVKYGVSRTSIREALRLLELSDFVEIRHGDGTFIKTNKQQTIQQQLTSVALKTDQTTLYEMLELRLILESQCAALAALRATGQDIEKIARTLEAMKNTDDEEIGIQADLDFHMAIAAAANNSVLAQLISSFASHMRSTISNKKTSIIFKRKFRPDFRRTPRDIYSD